MASYLESLARQVIPGYGGYRRAQAQEALQAKNQSLANLLAGNRPEPGFAGPSMPGMLQPQLPVDGGQVDRTGPIRQVEELLRSGSQPYAQEGLRQAQPLLAQQQTSAIEQQKLLQAQQQQEQARNTFLEGAKSLKLNPLLNFAVQQSAGNPVLEKQTLGTLTSLGAQREADKTAAQALLKTEKKDKQTTEKELRNKFIEQTGYAKDANEAMSKIMALGKVAATNPTASTSLIVQIARLNAPGIVTEADFEQLARAGGISDEMMAAWQRAKTGALPQEVINNLLQAAAVQYEGLKTQVEGTRETFTSLADRLNVSPANVGINRLNLNVKNLLIGNQPPAGFVVDQ